VCIEVFRWISSLCSKEASDSSIIQLLDRCLEILDPELYRHLLSKRLTAEIYAFPSVLTFCACTPPLDQVLQLWDFLLAYGVHLNVLCVIAQLTLMREDLMSSQRCVVPPWYPRY
jgi:cell cycle arrest protein BUB2